MQPFLSKDTRNKIVEVKVDGLPASCQKKSEGRNSFTGAILYRDEALLCSYHCGVADDQRVAYLPKEPKLSGVEATDREVGGPMLNVTGFNRFYYLRDFTDMRCKHSRVLSIISEQLHREPDDGDVFIVMSPDRRIVRLFMYIFAFLKDGSLPIDNNLAERAISPLTTQRNAILHFGSDEGRRWQLLIIASSIR